MKVSPNDGRCRSCNGDIEIIDADDATMTVQCTDSTCADTYSVETDAFGDGCMTYYPAFMVNKLRGGEQP